MISRKKAEMTRQFSRHQRTITATEIRRNFSAIIRRLRKRREHTVIQSDGVPVAVLLPIAEYERLMAHELIPIDKIRETLMESFGLWANRTDQPADSVEYVNEMRRGQRLDSGFNLPS